MKPYIINSFRRSNGGAIFTRATEGPNASKYVNANNATEALTSAQFICNGRFTIYSILRQTQGHGNNINQVIFTTGDFVRPQNSTGAGHPIAAFQLIDSDVVSVITGTGTVDDHSYPLHTLELVPQTPPPPPAPVQTNDQFFSALQATILQRNPRALRLRQTRRNRGTQTLENFMIRFFEEYNNERETIYTDTEGVQTTVGRRRSLEDIFMIARYYYPQITVREVVNLLYRILPAHFPRGFRTSLCSTIHKRVWYYAPTQDHLQHDRTTTDEYGNTFNAVLQRLN